MQGRGPVGPAPLIFSPNWGPKGRNRHETNFLETTPPSPLLSQGLDDRAPHLPEGLDSPLQGVGWFAKRKRLAGFWLPKEAKIKLHYENFFAQKQTNKQQKLSTSFNKCQPMKNTALTSLTWRRNRHFYVVIRATRSSSRLWDKGKQPVR